MAAKKKITKKQIINAYMSFVLEHNEAPKSVFIFAKDNNFEEGEFYKYFASFEALERNIFEAFFENALSLLNKNEDYQNFDARNKLLSFYYTFFENLTANRSYVVYTLSKHKNTLKDLKVLTGLKSSFTDYIETLGIQLLDFKQDQLDKIKDRSLRESAWFQLLVTMKFWMDDTSASFEKTDIFIEKSVNTTFDVLDVAPLKSVIDLGKFLFKEKMKMN